MRRRSTIVASWVVATLAATLLVGAGVGTIRDATRRDAALTAAIPVTAKDRGATPAGTEGTPPTSSSSTTVATLVDPTLPPPGPATTRAPAGPSSAAAPSSTRAASGSDDTTEPRTPTTAAAAPNTSIAPPTTATAPEIVTLVSTGGSVTVRASATAVVVMAATPNRGFTARVDQRGATAIRVEFESPTHRSRVEAWWDSGLRQDLREDS